MYVLIVPRFRFHVPFGRASLAAQREATALHTTRVQEEDARRQQVLEKLRSEREAEEKLLDLEFQTGKRVQEVQVRMAVDCNGYLLRTMHGYFGMHSSRGGRAVF